MTLEALKARWRRPNQTARGGLGRMFADTQDQQRRDCADELDATQRELVKNAR